MLLYFLVGDLVCARASSSTFLRGKQQAFSPTATLQCWPRGPGGIRTLGEAHHHLRVRDLGQERRDGLEQLRGPWPTWRRWQDRRGRFANYVIMLWGFVRLGFAKITSAPIHNADYLGWKVGQRGRKQLQKARPTRLSGGRRLPQPLLCRPKSTRSSFGRGGDCICSTNRSRA